MFIKDLKTLIIDKMKIAVLIPGHIRSYNEAKNSLFENIIDPIKKAGYIIDIFSSIWENSGYRETGWAGCIESTTLENDSLIFESEHHDRDFFIKKYSNEKWKHYPHMSNNTTCGDSVSMWYKVWKCYSLIDEKYDVIIKLRPDLVFYNKFDVSWLESIEKNTVYMAKWHGKYEIVTCQIMDQFGFGDSESMKKYCSVFPDIDKIITRNDSPFTGEGFLSSQLRHNNLNISRIHFKYGIMRKNGVVDDIS
jgi:hypothetical protein